MAAATKVLSPGVERQYSNCIWRWWVFERNWTVYATRDMWRSMRWSISPSTRFVVGGLSSLLIGLPLCTEKATRLCG